ncbi:MAG: cytoplasmic protein [Kiritimatiellia bacterium]
MTPQQQFEKFSASELFCPRCNLLQPVRERLLLVLPHSEIYEYRCRTCATSLGSREVTNTNRITTPFSA